MGSNRMVRKEKAWVNCTGDCLCILGERDCRTERRRVCEESGMNGWLKSRGDYGRKRGGKVVLLCK